MASYAVFLATGHTLQARSIKGESTNVYLHNVATFVVMFDTIDHWLWHPQSVRQFQTVLSGSASTTQYKRFEEIPERQKPFTLAMLHLHKERLYNLPKDCYRVALRCWFVIVIHSGYRQAECCQEQSCGALGMEKPSPQNGQQALAFTPHDIVFLGKHKQRITWATAFTIPNSILQVRVHHEWQQWQPWRNKTIKKKQ